MDRHGSAAWQRSMIGKTVRYRIGNELNLGKITDVLSPVYFRIKSANNGTVPITYWSVEELSPLEQLADVAD